MRPILTKNISSNEFQSYYWLKKELHLFCKEHHLPTSGSKEDLTNRILYYLQTGETLKPLKKAISPSSLKKNIPLSLDTVIDEHHRCNQGVRAFFKSVIGSRFHFSTHIQKFFKENVGKTYGDAVKEWYKEEERRRKKKRPFLPNKDWFSIRVQSIYS